MEKPALPPLSLLLDKIARGNAQRFAERIGDLDITPRHVGLLTAAAYQSSPSQAELATWLGVGPSAVVAIVDELEARGAVTRTPDPANRRRMIITVTPTGAALMKEATRRATELDRELFADLPAPLMEAFETATRLIAARLRIGHQPT